MTLINHEPKKFYFIEAEVDVLVNRLTRQLVSGKAYIQRISHTVKSLYSGQHLHLEKLQLYGDVRFTEIHLKRNI